MREARPITTQNPSVGLYRFATTAFPGHRTHVALQRQPFASAWPCRHTPFRGFQNVREARPITTQNPSVGLYRFATAFPSHREHVALPLPAPGQSPYSIQRVSTVSKRARSTAHHDTKPVCGPLPLCRCLPKSPRTHCPAAAALCQRLASRHTPCRGFQNVREEPPITTQNPSVGLYRFAAAFPGHRTHVDLQRQPCASAWPCRHNPCTALPLLPPVTANTLPCSGSPLLALGHVAISPYSTPSI